MPARRARARLAAPPLVLALVLPACGGDDGMAEATDEAGSSETDDEGPLRPSFSEPASGRLVLQTNRIDDLNLAVQGVTPGLTEWVVDGRSFGALPPDSTVGRLEAESLRIHVRGSVLPGRHRMLLRTVDATGVSESEEIIVDIAAPEGSGTFTAAVSPTGLPGHRVWPSGDDDDAVLVVLESTDDGPRVHLLPRAADGWDASSARTIAVPGLEEPAPIALPVSVLRHGRTTEHEGRVRVAWRVGPTGTRIDVVDVAWDDADPSVGPRISLTADDAMAGRPAEWGSLGRPWLMDDLLVAELWAPLDVEAPRPGDHAIVWSRVHPNADALDPPQRVSVRADLVDLDRLGLAIDPIARAFGGPARVSVRVDQNDPLILDADLSGGLRARPTVVDDRDRSFSFADAPLASITGAFGSRTVASLTSEGGRRLRVAFIDDLGDGGVTAHSLSSDDLPDLEGVRGELAVGQVAGTSVFLVPYGSETPVQLVYAVGGTIRTHALEPLRCDGVALADTADGDGGLPLACTEDGELRLGTLSLEPDP